MSPTTSNMLIIARKKREMGDREGAQQLQEVRIKKHPKDHPARMALASSYIMNNQDEMAIEQYILVLDRDENNLVVLNNLA